MFGTIVNALAVVVGAGLGIAFRKGIPERSKKTIMQGIGLAVLMVGLKMALKADNELIVIVSLALGGLLGEFMRIDYYLEVFAQKLEGLAGKSKGGQGNFVQGFVSASLIFCVGAMAIMGPLEGGLTGTYKILYVKSALDFVTSMILASSLGIGVLFSALPLLIYQGLITLLASGLDKFLTDTITLYMTATGGLLIVGIGVNILELKEINVANLLPAIFLAVFVTMFALAFFPAFV
jgi:uncharacterized membrane protein YqgA involved in biofilm formation